MKEQKDPFDFYNSPWWKSMNEQLCADGWPQVVVTLNCMIRDAKKAHEDLKQNSVPIDVVMGLVSGLKTLEEYIHGFNSEEAHHELCCQVPTVAREALEKFEAWQKGRRE